MTEAEAVPERPVRRHNGGNRSVPGPRRRAGPLPHRWSSRAPACRSATRRWSRRCPRATEIVSEIELAWQVLDGSRRDEAGAGPSYRLVGHNRHQRQDDRHRVGDGHAVGFRSDGGGGRQRRLPAARRGGRPDTRAADHGPQPAPGGRPGGRGLVVPARVHPPVQPRRELLAQLRSRPPGLAPQLRALSSGPRPRFGRTRPRAASPLSTPTTRSCSAVRPPSPPGCRW